MTRTITLHAQAADALTFEGQVAQTRILSNASLGILDACPAQLPPLSQHPRREAFGALKMTQGFIAGKLRDVQIATATCTQRMRLDFAGLGRLEIDLESLQSRSSGFTHVGAETEALLGPGLLLPLAQLGCFALHGSAIRIGTHAMALLAQSGSGKSTLVQHAGAIAATVLADDVLPIECADTPQLLPRFPQLKWAVPLAVADSREPLSALVFIHRGAATLGLRRMAAPMVLPLLIRDSVAARLFGRDLLTAHLRSMSFLAEHVAAYALDWPECEARALPPQARRALELLAALN